MPRWLKYAMGLAAAAGVAAWFLILDKEDSTLTPKASESAQAEPAAATNVGFILPVASVAEIDVWEETVRRHEAATRSIASIYRVAEGEPRSAQADLIRKAASEGCSALVILPGDHPEDLAEAVAEVRKGGTPVVLLDMAVPWLNLPPAPVVQYEDQVAVAKKLAEAAIRDAAQAGPPPAGPGRIAGDRGFPPDGPALIVRHARPDRHSEIRVKAFRDALEAAGVRVLPNVEFDGLTEEAKLAIRTAHESFPGVAIVYADDDLSLKGVSEYRHLLNRNKRRFVLVGHMIDSVLVNLSQHNVMAGLVQRNIKDPVQVAYDTALALARGETVENDIRTRTPLLVRNGAEIDGAFPRFLENPEMMGDKVPKSIGNPIRD